LLALANSNAVLVGAINNGTSYNNSINTSIVYEQLPSTSLSPKPANASSTYYGPNPWNVLGASGFGSSLAFGDLTNSNTASILAVGADQTGGSGAVYFIDTNSQPQSTLGGNQYLAHLASGLTLYGAQAQDHFGNGLVNLGDTNNDGYDDVLIQAFNASSGAGNGYVLFGSDNLVGPAGATNANPGTGNVAPGSIGDIKQPTGPGFTASILSAIGQGMTGNTGQGTFGPGDVNGDGLQDILLGSGPNGSAYLTWGQQYLEAINNLQLSKLTSNSGYMLDGLATSTAGSLRSIGDFNGDGYGDFISIEPGEFINTVRIELGANTQAILADYSYNYYSFTVSADTQVLPAGDINGDGLADLALFLNQNVSSAADGNQGGGSTTGIVYGRTSEQLPIGSGFGLLAPLDPATNAPLTPPPSQQISGGESSASPAVITVGDTLYAAVQGVGDGDTSIWFTCSSDGGSSWSTWSNLTFATIAAPSLAFFEQKLYMSFLNPDGELQLACFNPDSPSLSDWSTPATITTSNDPASTALSSVYTPQLINQGDALAVLWVNATDGTLYSSLSTTPDKVKTGYGAPSPWTAPKQLLERSETNGTVNLSPIKATAAPAATLLGADPVIAVNNGGTINIYSPGSSGSSLILASSFPASGSDLAISASVAPGLTTTDTGLALTYTNINKSVNLERLDFFSLDGEAKDGVILTADGFGVSTAGLQWQRTNLNASNSDLITVVATVPVVVNGNLLLTAVDATTSEVRITAIANGSDPASTTWLNTTIQLPDGNGGWLISQPITNATSTLIAAGDLDGDGLDDLLLSSDQVAVGGTTFTGLRVISGAGSPLAFAARNDARAAEQAVQLAPALPLNSPASVAASISAPGSLNLTANSAGQRYGLSASLSDSASWLASSNSLSSAQQLFSSAIASGSAAWSSTPTPPLTGHPALNTASTFGDLNGDGYNDYFDPDGSIWIASAPQAPVFSLWSIRAAGDVNGNGVDDVLLALTPQGPSYPAQSDGKPSAIYSALIDGALFKITNNSFNLSDLKAALNPYNSTELFDVSTMSSSDEYQSLQNWFSPILKYQAPVEIESVKPLVAGNSAYTQSATFAFYNNSPAPTLVHDASGNLYSITTQVSAGGDNTGVVLGNVLLLGVGQNSLDPNAIEVTEIDLTKASPLASGKTFPSDSIAPLTPGAAIHDGKLFVAIPSATSGAGYGSSTNNIWIAYAELNNSGKPLTEATSWTTYQVQSNGGVSDEYSLLTPTLVSEGERLALYFPSGDEGNNDGNLNIHYLYSNDPTQQTGWGSTLPPDTNTYTGTSSTISIDSNMSTTPSTQGWESSSGVIVTSPIAATTYQGRTVLAFRGYGDGSGDNVENGALLLAFAPTAQDEKANNATSSSTTGSSPTDWTLWDTGTTGINTPSIATDQANLYLTYTPWSTSSTNALFFPVALNIDHLAPNKPVDLSTDNLITAGTTQALPITLQQAGDDNVRINGNNTNIGMTSPYYAGGYFKDADTQANNIGNAPQSVTPSFYGNALYVTNQVGESAAVSISYNQQEAAFGSNQTNQAGFSLAGYSIDGNIDVDGDGFTDILLSDPSDPSLAVNNQYVLFGGDYLNIASQVGTAGNDTLIGTPLADVIYTLGGADEVKSKGGADVIYTGSGDDQISIADNAFVRIDAGSGFDQLRLQGQAGQTYDFTLNVAAPQYFAGTKLKDIELLTPLTTAVTPSALMRPRLMPSTQIASSSLALIRPIPSTSAPSLSATNPSIPAMAVASGMPMPPVLLVRLTQLWPTCGCPMVRLPPPGSAARSVLVVQLRLPC
jgi:hypothetical protein